MRKREKKTETTAMEALDNAPKGQITVETMNSVLVETKDD